MSLAPRAHVLGASGTDPLWHRCGGDASILPAPVSPVQLDPVRPSVGVIHPRKDLPHTRSREILLGVRERSTGLRTTTNARTRRSSRYYCHDPCRRWVVGIPRTSILTRKASVTSCAATVTSTKTPRIACRIRIGYGRAAGVHGETTVAEEPEMRKRVKQPGKWQRNGERVAAGSSVRFVGEYKGRGKGGCRVQGLLL